MDKHSDAKRFLQELFPDYGSHAIFAHSVDHPDPKKRMKHTRSLAGLDATRDCYWSVAAFKDDGRAIRQKGHASEVRALVIDDVGTKIPEAAVRKLGTPTAVVESSFMNCQWVYRLSSPVPINEWRAFALGVIILMQGPHTPEGLVNPVMLFRLPMGMNCKPERGGFPPLLVELNAGVVLDIALITPVGGSKAKAAKTTPHDGRIKNIKGVVALVPNNTGHNEWMARMHQIWVLAKDKEDGREAWLEFSGRWVTPKTSTCSVDYDPAAKWDDTDWSKPIDTAGQLLLEDACQANPDEFARIMNAEADDAFNDATNHAAALKDHAAKLAGKVEFVEDTQRAARAVLKALGGTVKRIGPGDWRQFDETVGRWRAYRDDHMLRVVEEAAFQRREARALSKGMAKKIGTVKYLRAVSTLAAINAEVTGDMGDFDADPLLLGVPSGVIDLRPGASRAVRVGQVGEMVSKATVCDPAMLGASGARWKKFLHEFTQGDTGLEDWLQVYAGYCLTGLTRHHVMPFFYGDGRNGKSVYLNTLRRVWGEYGMAIDKRLLFEKQGTPHGAFTAVLAGRRFGVLTDVKQDAVWDEEEVKRLTGGDEISANLMHQNPFNFMPVMKFAVGGNHQPGAKTMDAGLRERMKLVPLNSHPRVRDATLPFLLTAEYAEILRWALDGLDLYWANRGAAGEAGALAVSTTVEGATDAYNDVLDPFGRWQKRCLVKANSNTPMTEVYKSWDNFRNNEQLFGQKPSTIATLSRALVAMGFRTDEINDRSHLLGYTIKRVVYEPLF